MNVPAGLMIAAALALGVGACDSIPKGYVDPDEVRTVEDIRREVPGKLFGDDAFVFGGTPKASEDPGGGGIGVNSFLWRASLDTISFMPVNSADPFGGVIITDWHSPAQAQTASGSPSSVRCAKARGHGATPRSRKTPATASRTRS